MSVSFDSVTQREFALPLAIALLALAIMVLARLHVRAEKRWRRLMEGADGRSIETLLQEHLAERVRLEAEIESLNARVKRSELTAETAKRHVVLVRFDAFEEISGAQSFAVAVLDERGDGLVLTSIVGRETCRVFAKAIVAGRSERELGGEERRAIRDALESAPRAVVGA